MKSMLLTMLIAIFTFTQTVSAETPPSTSEPLLFSDLHYVSEEAGGLNAVKDYAEWLDMILRRHGGKVVTVFEVKSVRFGDAIQPNVIFHYEIASLEALRGVLEDPQYRAGVPRRDALFDFTKAHSFHITPLYAEKGQ